MQLLQNMVLPGRGKCHHDGLLHYVLYHVQAGTWGMYLPLHGRTCSLEPTERAAGRGGQEGSHHPIHLPGLPFSNGAAPSSRSSRSSDCVCVTRFEWVQLAGCNAGIGDAPEQSCHT